ncbi:WD domain, G-beta repeat [Musa troglodytarum]|uniref:WD domain, G-beta repeat n=1 Tax=Musa troglodytarum TaxID=320322 RepID=A0A9E7F058_9LILI|nr:WD domain, G-beta repeat [Musa troglodytarum]
MEREVARLGKGAICCGWNYCGLRLAVGFVDGSISIHDSLDSGSSSSASPSSSSKWKAHAGSVLNVVWAPPECGDAIACICNDGTFSLWEETGEDTEHPTWKLCKLFEDSSSPVLDLQFGADFQNVLDSVSRFGKIWEFDEAHQRWIPVAELALPGDDGDMVWQLEWDMGGMTLASTGSDGMVRLWQSNINGIWHEHASLDCSGAQS